MATAAADQDLDLEPTPPEVKRYQQLKLRAMVIGTILNLAGLAFLGIWAGPFLKGWFNTWLASNDWLRLLATAGAVGVVLELATFPLEFWSSFVLEHRYQLSNQTFFGWVWKRVKGYLVGGVLGGLLLLGLYALLWKMGSYWWLWASGGWLLATLVLGRLLPVLILPLFYRVTRLEDKALLDRLKVLAEGTGLNVEGIYRLHLSAETRKANAALAGLGRTRRVLLGDTLLENFSPEEIEVVFAHELGHHVHRHLIKRVMVNALLVTVGFWLVDWILGSSAARLGYGGLTDPAALPLVLLVLALFGLILAPAHNALGRFHERQCDRYALVRTRMPQAYRSAFIKLARLNKADPDPDPWVTWLFYDHPPIRQRLAMACSEDLAGEHPS